MYASKHCLTIAMSYRLNLQPFFMDEALLSNSQTGRGKIVKLLITLEPHGIFGSNFEYLFILTFSSHWNAKR